MNTYASFADGVSIVDNRVVDTINAGAIALIILGIVFVAIIVIVVVYKSCNKKQT